MGGTYYPLLFESHRELRELSAELPYSLRFNGFKLVLEASHWVYCEYLPCILSSIERESTDRHFSR